MVKSLHGILITLIFILINAANVPAQVRPDAGTLLQEQQRTEPPGVGGLSPPWEAPEKELAPLEETGRKFVVQGFRFTGIEGLATSAELDNLLKDAVGKEMGLANLRRIADRVTKYLQKKGWFLARAYIPQQEIKGGIVEIAIVAGRIHGGAVIRGEDLRISESRLQKMVASSVGEGEAANQQDIARSLLLMNDLPGISASSILEPGETPGTANLVVNAKEGPLLGGSAWVDNYGSRFTDPFRGSGLLRVNDPFCYGDQVSLNTTDNLNYQYGQANYAFPIGYNGLRAGFSLSEMRYQVDRDLLNVDQNGGSQVFDASVSYPILRSRTANLWAGADYNWKNLWDNTNGIQTDNKFVNVVNVHLYGDRLDTILGGGYSTVSAGLAGGSLDLSADSSNLIADQKTAGTNGAYGKFLYGANRLQKVYESLNLFVGVKGQVAMNNLDSSEQFILGGPDGVRAYPVGEAPGDSGGILTGELRYDFPEIQRVGIPQLVGFYDLGWTDLHQTPWTNSGTPIDNRNSYTLSGGGIGLNLIKPNLYAIRIAWAAKVGTNPGRSVAGLDADGKSDDNRYWIQAMCMF